MTQHDEYLASWHLFELLQDPDLADDLRWEYANSLLLLRWGFWQGPQPGPRPETLRGFVLRTCLRAVVELVRKGVRGSALDAEGVCQDVLLIFLRSAQKIKTSPAGWLIKVAVRKARGGMRKETRFLLADLIDGDEGIPPSSPLVEGDAADADGISEDTQAVRKAVSDLPEKLRVVANEYLNGKSHREIALALNITELTVRQRWSRARRALQRTLLERRRRA